MSAGSVSAQSYLARNRTRRSLADALRASVKGVALLRCRDPGTLATLRSKGTAIVGTLAAIWLVTGCDNSSTSLAPSPSSPPASTCVTLPEAPPRELTRFGAGTVGGLLLVDSSGIYTSSDSATHYRLTKNKLGKSPVIVAKELDRPEVIAMDATNIYWGGTGKTLAIPKTVASPWISPRHGWRDWQPTRQVSTDNRPCAAHATRPQDSAGHLGR